MTHREYLWCALNLLLDEEEALDTLCSACRAEALEGRCSVCGRPREETHAGENEGFDLERYRQLERGTAT